MTDWSIHPDAMALLDSARAASGDSLARSILADWLADNGQRGLAGLMKLSLRDPGRIHHATKNQATTLPGVLHAVDGWLLGGNASLQDKEPTKQPWVNGLHISGRGLGPQVQVDLLKALPALWSAGWRVLSLADFTVPPDSFIASLQKGWARHITHMRLGGPFACSTVLAAITQSSIPLETMELRSAWWRQDKVPGRAVHGRPMLPPPLDFGTAGPLLPPTLRRVSLENFTLAEGDLGCFLETLASIGTRHLGLNQCHFNSHALAAFNQSAIWNGLESLHLTGCRLPKHQPARNEIPLRPIPTNRIRSITLRACSLRGHSLQTLAACGWLSGPTKIDLSQNHLGDLDALALEENLDAESVESLNLAGCDINGERLGQWLGLGPWERLGQLNLAWNPLGEEGWRHLANGKNTPALQVLDATSTLVTLQGLEHFANGSLFPRLGRLALRGKNPGAGMAWPESIRTLLRHPSCSGLSHIRFDAPEGWIQQEVAHPECLLAPSAREDLLRLVEARLREKSHREAEEELNRQLLLNIGAHTGIHARWAARQRASRGSIEPTASPNEPGS